MGIQIGAKPDSGFDDPIGMLTDCHRRIERFLGILCLVAKRARGRALTDEEREAVDASLNYFRVGGVRHTADEEESLFPRIRTQCSPNESAELGGLESDHQRANELHTVVEDLYRKWIVADGLNVVEEEKILGATEELRLLYEEHIKIEERVVFPHAARVLSGPAIAAIGREFRERRG